MLLPCQPELTILSLQVLQCVAHPQKLPLVLGRGSSAQALQLLLLPVCLSAARLLAGQSGGLPGLYDAGDHLLVDCDGLLEGIHVPPCRSLRFLLHGLLKP